MKNYVVKVYDREMCIGHIDGLWESESAMLNELMEDGYKPVEWWLV